MRSDPLAMFRRRSRTSGRVLEVKSRACRWCDLSGAGGDRPERASSLAMRWLADLLPKAAARQEHAGQKLANEIIDAANERGESVKKREDTHRMADANKAFAHYRW